MAMKPNSMALVDETDDEMQRRRYMRDVIEEYVSSFHALSSYTLCEPSTANPATRYLAP